MKHWQIAFVVTLLTSIALAEDFKTVTGKEYKDATVIRVEGDGIILRTKTGISKIYFVELPEDVQEKFRPIQPTPIPARTPLNVAPKQNEPSQTHGGGKVVVVGHGVGTLKNVIGGIVLLSLVGFLVIRRFF